MSDNPYAPPSSDLGSELGAGALEGRGDFDIGQCLADGWANTWSNFPLWLAAGLVFLLASSLAIVTVVGALFVFPVLMWGATLFSLRMHDGGAEFGDIFAGFQSYSTALVGMLVCFVLLMLIGVAGQSLQTAGEVTGSTAILLVGFFANLAVFFLVSPRLTFAYLYVVDRGAQPLEALGRAWRDTALAKWKVAAMMVLSSVIVAAGVAALVVGVLPAMVLVTLMWVSAYRQLVGRPA